jgi:hypothetical protein
VISPNGPVTTVDHRAPITDPAGNPGFPGFDGMSAANTLGDIAQMQEAGVAVTYGYILPRLCSRASGGEHPPVHQ